MTINKNAINNQWTYFWLGLGMVSSHEDWVLRSALIFPSLARDVQMMILATTMLEKKQ